jgi:S1-C subfamily serine protease
MNNERLPIEWPEARPVIRELPPAPPPTAPKRPWTNWGLPLIAGLVGAGLAIGIAFATGFGRERVVVQEGPTDRIVVTEILSPEETTDISTRAAAVARRVTPSVVAIQVANGISVAGSGSGVILDGSNGYIVTNEHVVDDASTVTVVLSNGSRYEADVLGIDVLTDLAVLKIEAESLVAIELGSTDNLIVGDGAVAVGNPLGLGGSPTVTVGVVSAFDRKVEGTSPAGDLYGMLQTDAPFNKGSSGGALVDLDGRLIGITTAVGVSDLGAEGLGFATPVEVMSRVADEIIATGFSGHGFLGIEGLTSWEPQADGGQAPVGVLVSRILEGSAAGTFGVAEGDVIKTVEGISVTTMDHLISRLRRFSPGDQIRLEIDRQGELMEIVFPIGDRNLG